MHNFTIYLNGKTFAKGIFKNNKIVQISEGVSPYIQKCLLNSIMSSCKTFGNFEHHSTSYFWTLDS